MVIVNGPKRICEFNHAISASLLPPPAIRPGVPDAAAMDAVALLRSRTASAEAVRAAVAELRAAAPGGHGGLFCTFLHCIWLISGARRGTTSASDDDD